MKTNDQAENAARDARVASFAIEERVLVTLPRVAQAVRRRHQAPPVGDTAAERAAESRRLAEEWAVVLGTIETATNKFVEENKIQL
jgi:hypothetical protein